ncbi:hypothetical protein quinque_016487 [Culex quinquefasciatus]
MGDATNNKKILQNIKMPEQSNDYRVVVFGAGGVGKSSLVLRFIKGTFRESYIPTIEDTYRQVISCNKNICTLQIHRYDRVAPVPGHAAAFHHQGDMPSSWWYSVCSKQSLEELKPIWSLIRELKGDEISQIPVMLVGNKCDEPEELREVTNIEGQTEAATWGISFMETSAKENHNVTEAVPGFSTAKTRRKGKENAKGKAKEEKLLKEKKEKAKQQAKEKEKQTAKEAKEAKKKEEPKDKAANGTNAKGGKDKDKDGAAGAAAGAEGEASGTLKEKCKVM